LIIFKKGNPFYVLILANTQGVFHFKTPQKERDNPDDMGMSNHYY